MIYPIISGEIHYPVLIPFVSSNLKDYDYPILFWTIYLFLVISGGSAYLAFMCFDSMFFTFCCQCATQIEIQIEYLKKFKTNSKTTTAEFLRQVYVKHIQLLDLIRSLNSNFDLTISSQFLHTLILLCISFLVSTMVFCLKWFWLIEIMVSMLSKIQKCRIYDIINFAFQTSGEIVWWPLTFGFLGILQIGIFCLSGQHVANKVLISCSWLITEFLQTWIFSLTTFMRS